MGLQRAGHGWATGWQQQGVPHETRAACGGGTPPALCPRGWDPAAAEALRPREASPRGLSAQGGISHGLTSITRFPEAGTQLDAGPHLFEG